MKSKFAYTDERDKSYGLSGIVITMNVLDSEGMLHKVTLDADDGESVMFTPDFYFFSNPRYSARITWNETLKQYQLLVGMIVGNVLSRNLVQRHSALTGQNVRDMRDLVAEEGAEVCALEDDEIDTVFTKTYRYLNNVFSDTEVHYIVDSLAAELIERRTLSGDEVSDLLAALRRR